MFPGKAKISSPKQSRTTGPDHAGINRQTTNAARISECVADDWWLDRGSRGIVHIELAKCGWTLQRHTDDETRRPDH